MTDTSTYDRPWKSFQDQLLMLEERGLAVSDRDWALAWLQRVGYYRLSAYWYPFRIFRHAQDPQSGAIRSVRTDDFMPGTTFTDAIDLYLFDRRLRVLLADALERIEVSLRVEVAYRLGKTDTFAHLHESNFHPTFRERRAPGTDQTVFATWQMKYQGLVQRSREDFVKHYREKHGPDLPIWVAIEVWDFGAVSQLLAMMKVPDQQAIAERYGITDWKVFASWVRCLSYLRNLVAHHSRVWNRNMVSSPTPPSAAWPAWGAAFENRQDLLTKPFIQLAMVCHLVRVICPGSSWPERMAVHLDAFPSQASTRQLSAADIGAPNGWKGWWLASDRQ
ncbi:Abi family protein [Xanthomonas campestris]|uniref:Abi family protein n=1 Tax=Xanthomonas campestris TaxID=339 RepID=UPI0024B686B6|nr:Abi family protein [Xanthomonas campestris]WHO92097.1 Abi family protein [Xanthomonas campestris]